MAKRKTHTAESPEMTPDYHVTPDGPVTTATAPNDVEQAFADAGIQSGSEVEQPKAEQRKPWPPIREFATYNAPENRVHLGKNDRFRTRTGATGAFFIYFDKNPNEGRDKSDPHPVIAHMKEAGYRYEPAPDGEMAWTKPYDQGRAWSIRQQMDAKDVAAKAANLMGASIEVGQSR